MFDKVNLFQTKYHHPIDCFHNYQFALPKYNYENKDKKVR